MFIVTFIITATPLTICHRLVMTGTRHINRILLRGYVPQLAIFHQLLEDAMSTALNRCSYGQPTEIFCRLQKKYPAAFRNSNVVNMGRLLVGLGVERVRTRHGSAYRVVPV